MEKTYDWKDKSLFGGLGMTFFTKIKDAFVFIFSSKLFLSIGSFYLFILFYLISNEILLFPLANIHNYIIYFLIGLIFSLLCLLAIINKKEEDNQDKIKSIRPLEFTFIPAYFGLLIISLSLGSFLNRIEVIFLSLIIYLIWFKLENVSFFNFYWLFLNYRFYEINTEMSSYILITKRKDVKNCKTIKDLKLKRINNYSFIEVKKQEVDMEGFVELIDNISNKIQEYKEQIDLLKNENEQRTNI